MYIAFSTPGMVGVKARKLNRAGSLPGGKSPGRVPPGGLAGARAPPGKIGSNRREMSVATWLIAYLIRTSAPPPAGAPMVEPAAATVTRPPKVGLLVFCPPKPAPAGLLLA